MITEQQKRVIRENPHLQAGKLARFLGLTVAQVKYARPFNVSWSYQGFNIPFCQFDKSDKPHWSIRKGGFRVAKSSNLVEAICIIDHLIWCIENNIFNQPRIEHPYLENLKFGE